MYIRTLPSPKYCPLSPITIANHTPSSKPHLSPSHHYSSSITIHPPTPYIPAFLTLPPLPFLPFLRPFDVIANHSLRCPPYMTILDNTLHSSIPSPTPSPHPPSTHPPKVTPPPRTPPLASPSLTPITQLTLSPSHSPKLHPPAPPTLPPPFLTTPYPPPPPPPPPPFSTMCGKLSQPLPPPLDHLHTIAHKQTMHSPVPPTV
ncbi:unnamed protein product [Dicrocoelium dendriticum]|nr:unnamed protein product [Dicrocoelium dendriticum]